MRASALIYLILFAACAIPACATVTVTSPSNNSTVGSTVRFTGSATTACSKGVASMGVYVDNALKYTANGNKVDASLSLAAGKHMTVMQEWDYCGGSTSAAMSITVSTSTGVSVSSPANNSNVGSPTTYVASATTGCAKGVAAIGVYVDNQLVYKANGASMNAPISMSPGSHSTMVQQWDNCGASSGTPVKVNVSGTSIRNLQAAPGWNQWGQLPPKYDICDAPCPGVYWSMTQNQRDPSLSGNSTQFYIGGTTPYSDVLFSNPVIGQGNKQGLTDSNHTLLPKLHDFTLDTDVYVTNWAVTQVLEFDVNMYAGGVGMEWGTECNHLNGNVWDYWNNVNAQWIHTSIPCTLKNGWNHVTLQVHRQPNNDVLYQSVTVNGTTYPMNITVAPKQVDSGWWGMTVNYQMDGNYKMDGYTTYLDNTTFTYW